jgi:predicted permease
MLWSIRPRIRRGFRLAIRRRDLTEHEIDEELRAHFDHRVAQLVARGMSHSQAERVALEKLGSSWEETLGQLHEAGHARDARLDLRERFDIVRHDLAYALRTLGRQPAFASLIVFTFALGIGANVTMFGVIDRLLLRPPPHVRQPAELFEVSRAAPNGGSGSLVGFQYPLYLRLRDDTAAFSEVAVASFVEPMTMGSGPDAEQLFAVLANSDYFRVLGARPALGRLFGPSEAGELPASDVVVLSHGFWQRRFAGDPRILGKTIRLGPRDLTVIGIAPEGFAGVDARRVDAWIPIGQAQVFHLAMENWPSHWGHVWVRIYARLKPGVTPEAAATRASTLYQQGVMEWGRGPKAAAFLGSAGSTIAFRSILPSVQLADNPEARLARLLLAVSAVVLLIACVNVGSLLLARGTERKREIAVRLALGVSRGRLLRLLIAETALLALVGGVIAVAVSRWGIAALQATLLKEFTWAGPVLDGRAAAAALALVAVTIVLAGVAPAFRASRPNVVEALKAGGREGGTSVSRVRTALIVAQVALSVVLIVGAGLFVQSLKQAASMRLGYDTRGILSATMDVEPIGYTTAARLALYTDMRERVMRLPGVASATMSATHPLLGWGFGVRVRVPGLDTVPQPPGGGPFYNAVGPDYFSTLGLRIVEGRPITAADIASEAHVAVLSEAMARAYWPGGRAVDRCIMMFRDSTCRTIVGVAADAKEGLKASDPRWLIYVPAAAGWNAGANALLVRARDGNATAMVEPIRRAMQGLGPNLPYAEVQALDDLLAPEIRPWRTGAALFSLFGLLALVISAVGLYSVISYNVAQRRHEFGVRIALGAQIKDVVRHVMDQGLRAALIGAVLGSAAAIALGGVVTPLLFETSPRSPVAYATAGALIVIVAAFASAMPAWGASRVDPVAALRGE